MGNGLIETSDGSFTLYSKQFDQNYHSTKAGALNESLTKHVVPALTYHKDKTELNILDICFGIGYNTLATLYYAKLNNLNIKFNIFSPEFDLKLIKSLSEFKYPKEFDEYKNIIKSLHKTLSYKDENIQIEIYNGDAREYIKILKNITKETKGFDIVYQDAFSSDVNRSLWTKEYFKDISKILSLDAIITTYSIATPVRLSMWENGINIYEYKKGDTDKSTIGLNKKELDTRYKYIDMELKKLRNTSAKALKDIN